jgi:uncharacterized protein (TIGR00255 family)
MLHSMTGFGRAEATVNGLQLKAEMRSLNSKFLDLSLKVPKELSDKENEIRVWVSERLKRGKVTLTLDLTTTDAQATAIQVNEDLLKAYYLKFKQLGHALGDQGSDYFKLALYSPDVLTPRDSADITIEWKVIEKLLDAAGSQCEQFRAQEGAQLQQKMETYIRAIGSRLEGVVARDPQRVKDIRARIDKNLDEIRSRTQVDENRFEQELIYYVEKLDITEEKVRLKQHLDYFLSVMTEPESQGKKLGFISQEIGREINTIGSKANDAEIQKLVVDMKDELEKIKEQLSNII